MIQWENFYRLPVNCFGYITTGNSLCESFSYCCLTNSRFSNKTRVVLGSSSQDLDHSFDLRLPSNNRIQFTLQQKVKNQFSAKAFDQVLA